MHSQLALFVHILPLVQAAHLSNSTLDRTTLPIEIEASFHRANLLPEPQCPKINMALYENIGFRSRNFAVTTK